MRAEKNTCAKAPAVIGAMISEGGVLKKASRQIACLRGREKFHRGWAQIAAAFECSTVEEHLAEARVIRRCRVESTVALRRTARRAEVGPRWHRFEQTGLFIPCTGGDELGTEFRRQVKSSALHS